MKTGKGLALSNLGIEYIYTNLKSKYPNLSVGVVDGYLYDSSKSEICKKIIDYDPKIVGFSTTFVNLADALNISKDLKDHNPNIITVIGGPGAKSLEVLANKENIKQLDYCVIGDGEGVLGKIIENGKNQTPTEYRKDTIHDLNSLEFPSRECFNTEGYIEINKKTISTDKRCLSIITSKGCGGGCTYCTVDKDYRVRGPENIEKEIKYLVKKFGITKLFIVDDNLFSYKDINRIYEICDIFKGYPNLKWTSETRVMDFTRDTKLSKEILNRMKQSGCDEIAWGVESGDNRILRNLRKGITTEDVEKVISLASEAEITSELLIMYDLPGENKKSLDNTLVFLDHILSKYRVNLVRVSKYANIPGSIGWGMDIKKNVTDKQLDLFKKKLENICSKKNIILKKKPALNFYDYGSEKLIKKILESIEI